MPQGQNCSTPLNPGDYAKINLPKFQIPEIPPVILNQLKTVKSLKIELTLMNSKDFAHIVDLACMSTKIDIHVLDDDENNGIKMFNSNAKLGAMLLLNFLYINF